jgi:uncharacterized protein YidB (DUF937 family)
MKKCLREFLPDNSRANVSPAARVERAAPTKSHTQAAPRALHWAAPSIPGRLHNGQENDMGLLDSIVGQVAGALGNNGGAGGQEHPGMVDVVSSLLTQGGGLQGLINQFGQQGLGNVVSSWVGTGQNLPISAEQLQAVLGEPHVAEIAAKLGLSPQDAAAQLANLLPHAVDSVTPDGAVPQGNLLAEALNAFTALRR